MKRICRQALAAPLVLGALLLGACNDEDVAPPQAALA